MEVRAISEDLNWYVIITNDKLRDGDIIEQGDILPKFPCVIPNREGSEIIVTINKYDVIILTQSCDLSKEKTNCVILAPIYSFDSLLKKEASLKGSFYRSTEGMNSLCKGNEPAYHLLQDFENKEYLFPVSVVDFKQIYSEPFSYVKEFAKGLIGNRIRMKPPFREHLSQAFARFFMRVGLPDDSEVKLELLKTIRDGSSKKK